MNIKTVFETLKLKVFLLHKSIYFILVLIPLTQGVWAEPISSKEKEHVISELEDCLRHDVVYMSNIPKYQEIGLIATNFRKAWESAKEKAVEATRRTVLGRENKSRWEEAAETNDRSTFALAINTILGTMFSHLHLIDAKESLKEELDSYLVRLGITYRESAIKSSNQEYVVLTVKRGGQADKQGVKVGDRFCLCDPTSVTIKYAKLRDNKTKESFSVRFYSKGVSESRVYIGKPIELSSILPDSSDNSIEYYERDEAYIQKLNDQYKAEKPRYIAINVESFSQGKYPGAVVVAKLRAASSNNVENLVIDLRGNSGGNVGNLNHLLSFFIPAGKHEPYGVSVTKEAWDTFRESEVCQDVVRHALNWNRRVDDLLFQYAANYFKEKTPELCRFVPLDEITRRRQLFRGKVAVFIDRNTASAAENCTAVLKNFLGERCKVIGELSAGALLTVSGSRYAGSFEIVYPYKDYLPINGVRVEGRGIKPDIKTRNLRDTQAHYDEAKKWFRSEVAQGHPAPVPRQKPRVPRPTKRQTLRSRRGIIIDSYWVAFVNELIPKDVDKVRVAGQIYPVNKLVLRDFNIGGSTSSIMLLRVSTPILEIPKDYNYRHGVGDIQLPSGLPDVSRNLRDVVGAHKEDQDLLYSKSIRTWVDSIVLKDACR